MPASKAKTKTTPPAKNSRKKSSENSVPSVADVRIRALPVADIIPTPDNPRVIDEKAPAFLELVESVRGQGVLVPVLVRAHPDKRKKNKWDLRYGERRVRAALAAGLTTVPAIVRQLTDEAAFELTFAENYAREDLTPIEEGRAVETLAAKFHGDVKAIAAKLGRSEKWVHLRMRLQTLSKSWRDLAAQNPTMTVGHLVALTRFTAEIQEMIWDEEQWEFNEIPVPSLAEWESKLNNEWVRALAAAPFDLADATLDKKAGACTNCIKRSSAQGQLWHQPEETADEIAKSDRCLDNDCWHRKLQAHGAARLKTLHAEHPDAVVVSVHQCYSGALRDTREASKAFANAMASDSYTEVKKQGENTVEAIVVDGPEPGRLIHIKKTDSGRGRGVSSSSSSSPKTASTPTPLKARRKVLKSKRLAELLKQLLEKVEPVTFEDLDIVHVGDHAAKLGRLVACIGTIRSETHAGDDAWSDYDALPDIGPDSAKRLWPRVREVLLARLRSGSPITQTHHYYEEESKRVAEFCGIDWDELWAAACEVYKEPKSWANLNADGTPKTNGKAKSKPKQRTETPGICRVCGGPAFGTDTLCKLCIPCCADCSAKTKADCKGCTSANRQQHKTHLAKKKADVAQPALSRPNGPPPAVNKKKSKKLLPVFSTEQLAAARKRPHIEIPDGPSLLIIQEADDIFACWWISPAGETEKRLPKKSYPDCDDIADAIEDIKSYANEHGHDIINPAPEEADES